MNEGASIDCPEPGVASEIGRCFLIHWGFVVPFSKRRKAGTLCLLKLRIHAKCFRRNELVKVLVVSAGQLVPEVLVCKPDLAGTSPSFDDESIKVALTVIDYGNPAHFLKRFLTLPE